MDQTSCLQEVFIPIKISTRKGRRAIVRKFGNSVNTPLSRRLVKAYWLQSRLQKYNDITLKEFCEIHKISPRYVRNILVISNLSPKIQQLIMDGYYPRHLSIQDILSKQFPVLWKDQEEVFVR
jgi:subtilase family serine protease